MNRGGRPRSWNVPRLGAVVALLGCADVLTPTTGLWLALGAGEPSLVRIGERKGQGDVEDPTSAPTHPGATPAREERAP